MASAGQTTWVERFMHRAKITGANISRRPLESMVRHRVGPAARLEGVLLDPARVPGCEASLLVEPTDIDPVEPRFHTGGEIERDYVRRMLRPRRTSPAGTITADGVDVSVPSGMHVWRGKVFEEALLDVVILTNPKYLLAQEALRFRPGRQRHGDEAVLLTMPWHHNFYHWLIEILPRLLLCEQRPELATLPLVVPRSSPSFVTDSLRAYGFLDRAVLVDDGAHRFDRLHLLTRLSPSNVPAPAAVRWLDERLDVPPGPTRRRIYVSRANARYRFVSNEDAVRRLLEPAGFETVLMGGRTFEEDIRLFREADVVIGSSGAAFSRIAYMKPGTAVIEFFPSPSDYWGCFQTLATLREVRYGFMVGRPDGLGYAIDVAALGRLLEEIDRPDG